MRPASPTPSPISTEPWLASGEPGDADEGGESDTGPIPTRPGRAAAEPGLAAAPLLPVTAAFALGIAGASCADVPPTAALTVATAALAVAVWALARSRLGWAGAWLLGGVTTLGVAHGAGTPMPAEHVARLRLPASVALDGRLRAEPVRFAPDRARISLEAEGVDEGAGRRPARGLVQITVYGIPPALGQGQRIAVRTTLRRPASFQNPGSFDHAAHLAREGIAVVGSARAERVLPLTADDPPWPVAVRRWALHAAARALPEASAALLSGLLLGERTALPREIDEAFRRVGAYHVLAVSGFNVALVAASVLALLSAAGVGGRASLVTAAGALVGFALVVGGQPSVLRATFMGLAVTAAALAERESQAKNALSLSALALLLAYPFELWDPGFQLSFAATAGIVHVAAPLGRSLAERGVPHWLALLIAASLAAQAAALPFMILHFNQLSLIGPVANLAVVPLAGLATVLGMLALFAAAAGDWIAGLLWPALWIVLLALRGVVWLAAQAPAAVVHLPAPSPVAVLAWCLALGLVPALGSRRFTRPAAGGFLALALGLGAWPWLAPEDGRLRVTMLDVGQGDAVLVEIPGGHRLLVDGGAGGPHRFDVGSRVVAPYLWNRPIARLDAVAITHADADHAGGLPAVLRHFRVGEIWDTGRWPPGSGETLRAVKGAGAPVVTLAAGDQRVLGEALVTVLSPAGGSLASRPNDDSLVLRLDWRNVALLLTGDLGGPGEARLLEQGAPLRALVLKVAHHGSRSSTSPAWLEAVQPGVALVSVGRGNRFGHPSEDVLRRLRDSGARVYRTDRDGAIVLETDGVTLDVTCWAWRRRETIRLEPNARQGGATQRPSRRATRGRGRGAARGARRGASRHHGLRR